MKLYYHPVSTTCRAIMLLAADEGLALDYALVDLFTGAHLQPAFAAVNPSQQVPVLEDGDFRLTESSAILKYLAEQAGSQAYPTELRARARVNELMDWFNTGLSRDLCYGAIYPQALPSHKREDAAVQAAHLAWGCEKAQRWLTVLDRDLLGASKTYLCGDRHTIADDFGIALVTLGEVTRFDYSPWPNLSRWIATMKARPNWSKVNEGFYAHFVSPYKDTPFVAL